MNSGYRFIQTRACIPGLSNSPDNHCDGNQTPLIQVDQITFKDNHTLIGKRCAILDNQIGFHSKSGAGVKCQCCPMLYS